MRKTQTGILADLTTMARYLEFSINSVSDIKIALQNLESIELTDDIVIGIGQSLVHSLGKEISGLYTMPAQTANGIDIPSTPGALWCWLRGSDRGELFHRSRLIENMLAPGFALTHAIDSFQYDKNRDMSGYEDGTENPDGDNAFQATIVQNMGLGLDGSSFVTVQQWLHNFDKFDEMTVNEQDDVFGRHVSDNEEFEEAPVSAHVKRTAQESFSPEAFIVRRSMPWSEGVDAGLVFVSFGHSFDAFEALFNRMLGKEDDIVDGLFSFTQPISGSYYWCPPVKDGKLDLTVLGF